MNQSTKSRVLDVLYITRFSHHCCRHYDLATRRQCSVRLSERSVFNAHYITNRFASQAPIGLFSTTNTVHSFSFVDALRQLATSVYCPVHARPSKIADVVLFWLNTATRHPNLFTLSGELHSSLHDLHDLLPRFARDDNTVLWEERLSYYLSSLEIMVSLRRSLLERINDLVGVFQRRSSQSNYVPVLARLTSIRINDQRQESQDSGQHTSNLDDPSVFQPVDNIIAPAPSRVRQRSSTPFQHPVEMNSPSSPDRSSPPPTTTTTTSHLTANNGRDPQEPRLPVVEHQEYDTSCPICMEPFRGRVLTSCCTCRKSLHYGCMWSWAYNIQSRLFPVVTCPCCRAVWHDQQMGRGDAWVEEVTDSDDEDGFEPLQFGFRWRDDPRGGRAPVGDSGDRGQLGRVGRRSVSFGFSDAESIEVETEGE